MDRRLISREPVSKAAHLFFGAQGSTFQCSVRDASGRGAQISLDRSYALPKHFLLSVDGFHTARNCRLIWVKGNFFGVAFQAPTSITTSASAQIGES